MWEICGTGKIYNGKILKTMHKKTRNMREKAKYVQNMRSAHPPPPPKGEGIWAGSDELLTASWLSISRENNRRLPVQLASFSGPCTNNTFSAQAEA